jgi:xylulose-5-phosphate/fructose-6-phosphate phosphoketolase
MRDQKPEELFDQNGKLIPELKELAPVGQRRMSANPHANGGVLKKALRLPSFSDYGVKVDQPGAMEVENVAPLGTFLRDVMKLNMTNFRVFGPDSFLIHAIYRVSKKFWIASIFEPDSAVGADMRRRNAQPSTMRLGFSTGETASFLRTKHLYT